jgi:hypothetical protein
VIDITIGGPILRSVELLPCSIMGRGGASQPGHSTPRFMKRSLIVAALALACFRPAVAAAHPGTGIVIDRNGNVYFVDMVSGVWRVDRSGALTHTRGPGFHWLALDEDGRLAGATLPLGSAGDVVRLGKAPTLILASDFPIATGSDGSLYYPTHGGARPIQILRLRPSGQLSVFATLPAGPPTAPLRELNGIALGRDGSVYYTENDAVRRVDMQGRLSTVAQHVSPSNCASIPGISTADVPLLRGLAVDSAGVVYVAATGCGSLLRITPSGGVTMILRSDGEFSPTGVALSGSRVYVLEFLGAGSDDRPAMIPRVRVVESDGTTRTLATVHR